MGGSCDRPILGVAAAFGKATSAQPACVILSVSEGRLHDFFKRQTVHPFVPSVATYAANKLEAGINDSTSRDG